jgi:hypothetical protein
VVALAAVVVLSITKVTTVLLAAAVDEYLRELAG